MDPTLPNDYSLPISRYLKYEPDIINFIKYFSNYIIFISDIFISLSQINKDNPNSLFSFESLAAYYILNIRYIALRCVLLEFLFILRLHRIFLSKQGFFESWFWRE